MECIGLPEAADYCSEVSGENAMEKVRRELDISAAMFFKWN
jgi:hypothetical protein